MKTKKLQAIRVSWLTEYAATRTKLTVINPRVAAALYASRLGSIFVVPGSLRIRKISVSAFKQSQSHKKLARVPARYVDTYQHASTI
ncbi:MAG: hypothetical protein ACREHG_00035 [Candidatus Saccharimonadales bacterium]